VYPSAAVRKLKFNRKCAELVIARVRGVPIVVIGFGYLSKEAQVQGTAQCVVGDPDCLGDSRRRVVRVIVAALLLRNGDGLSPYLFLSYFS
jgi:hypothetical protein